MTWILIIVGAVAGGVGGFIGARITRRSWLKRLTREKCSLIGKMGAQARKYQATKARVRSWVEESRRLADRREAANQKLRKQLAGVHKELTRADSRVQEHCRRNIKLEPRIADLRDKLEGEQTRSRERREEARSLKARLGELENWREAAMEALPVSRNEVPIESDMELWWYDDHGALCSTTDVEVKATLEVRDEDGVLQSDRGDRYCSSPEMARAMHAQVWRD